MRCKGRKLQNAGWDFKEMSKMFPSKIMNIGGDEVNQAQTGKIVLIVKL